MSTPESYKRLTNLLHFARVVDAGSFAEAARRAGTTTSAMSKAVTRFERQHRVRLLHRTTHAISLTAEGERLLDGARDLLREAERLEATLDEAVANDDGGRVRLSAPAPLIRACLARQTPALLRAQPRIELDLLRSDGGLDLASNGIDVAIHLEPLIGSPGLIAARLGSFPWVLCGTPRYVEFMGTPASPADLEGHRHIGLRDPATGRVVAWGFTDPVTGDVLRLPPRPRLCVEDMSAAWEMMRQGLGLAWLPAWVGLADLRAGRAVELLPTWRMPETDIFASRLARRHTPRRVRTFLTSLAVAAAEWRPGLTGPQID